MAREFIETAARNTTMNAGNQMASKGATIGGEVTRVIASRTIDIAASEIYSQAKTVCLDFLADKSESNIKQEINRYLDSRRERLQVIFSIASLTEDRDDLSSNSDLFGFDTDEINDIIDSITVVSKVKDSYTFAAANLNKGLSESKEMISDGLVSGVSNYCIKKFITKFDKLINKKYREVKLKNLLQNFIENNHHNEPTDVINNTTNNIYKILINNNIATISGHFNKSATQDSINKAVTEIEKAELRNYIKEMLDALLQVSNEKIEIQFNCLQRCIQDRLHSLTEQLEVLKFDFIESTAKLMSSTIGAKDRILDLTGLPKIGSRKFTHHASVFIKTHASNHPAAHGAVYSARFLLEYYVKRETDKLFSSNKNSSLNTLTNLTITDLATLLDIDENHRTVVFNGLLRPKSSPLYSEFLDYLVFDVLHKLFSKLSEMSDFSIRVVLKSLSKIIKDQPFKFSQVGYEIVFNYNEFLKTISNNNFEILFDAFQLYSSHLFELIRNIVNYGSPTDDFRGWDDLNLTLIQLSDDRNLQYIKNYFSNALSYQAKISDLLKIFQDEILSSSLSSFLNELLNQGDNDTTFLYLTFIDGFFNGIKSNSFVVNIEKFLESLKSIEKSNPFCHLIISFIVKICFSIKLSELDVNFITIQLAEIEQSLKDTEGSLIKNLQKFDEDILNDVDIKQFLLMLLRRLSNVSKIFDAFCYDKNNFHTCLMEVRSLLASDNYFLPKSGDEIHSLAFALTSTLNKTVVTEKLPKETIKETIGFFANFGMVEGVSEDGSANFDMGKLNFLINFSLLLLSETPDGVADFANCFNFINRNEFLEALLILCEMISHHVALKEYVLYQNDRVNHQEVFVEIINDYLDKNIDLPDLYRKMGLPIFLTSQLLSLDIGRVVLLAFKEPDKLSEIIQDFLKENNLRAGYKLLSLISSHSSNLLQGHKIFGQSFFSQFMLNNITNYLHDCDYSNRKIESRVFVNYDIKNVYFVESILINCNFFNAKFEHVNFYGASLDKYTFSSLREVMLESPRLLRKVKLVGDFSDVDFSDLDLTYIDFSAVTSLQNANFHRAIFPNKLCSAQNDRLDHQYFLLLKDSNNIKTLRGRVGSLENYKVLSRHQKKSFCCRLMKMLLSSLPEYLSIEEYLIECLYGFIE